MVLIGIVVWGIQLGLQKQISFFGPTWTSRIQNMDMAILQSVQSG
jgi:hypothetical protein